MKGRKGEGERGGAFAKRSHSGLRSLRPAAGNSSEFDRSDQIRPLKIFCKTKPTPEKGRKMAGVKGENYETKPLRSGRRFGVSAGFEFGGIRKMRNEAIPEEREKGGWGAGEDGGATGDFYQTKPINSPAHFTPGGLKSALHVNYGTNPLGGQKGTGERESWIPHSNFFIRV